MNNVQLPFLVEGILILAAALFGFLLRAKGKPYGKVKVVIHLFFFLWFTTGYGFIVYSLSAASLTALTWTFVIVMGLAVAAQLVTGIVMLVTKTVGKTLPKIHLTSALLLFLCDLGAFLTTGTRS